MILSCVAQWIEHTMDGGHIPTGVIQNECVHFWYSYGRLDESIGSIKSKSTIVNAMAALGMSPLIGNSPIQSHYIPVPQWAEAHIPCTLNEGWNPTRFSTELRSNTAEILFHIEPPEMHQAVIFHDPPYRVLTQTSEITAIKTSGRGSGIELSPRWNNMIG